MDKDAEAEELVAFHRTKLVQGALHYISLSFLLLENVSEHKK